MQILQALIPDYPKDSASKLSEAFSMNQRRILRLLQVYLI